jgi:hypothetical protein
VLAAILVVGGPLRVWLALGNSGLTMDSPLYVRMAEELGRPEPLGPAHHGYPALVALAGLVIPGREPPGRVVSLVAGVLLILCTWAIARRTHPGWPAGAAAALVAAHPLLAVFSGPIMTESTFQLLAYASLLALVAGRAAVGGAVLGFAYCVRPEALVIAAAALPTIAGARRRAAWLGAFLLLALPEVAMLSLERGSFTITPKTALVAAAGAREDDAEWRAATADSMAAEPARPWLGRARATVPAAAARYPSRLAGQAARLLQAWPAPLLALSMVGAVVHRGPLLAPLAVLPVLPILGMTPHLRHPQTLVPALALFAAFGAAWLMAWAGARRSASGRLARLGVPAAVALLMAWGLAWCWSGPAGGAARRFDDGPMRSLRVAGEWLGVHGRPGALVMDRKPYVPFFAGMRQALMPDDEYDAIVDYAVRTGVDYLVVEEYVMWGMRRQFVPLMTEPAAREGEKRLRMIYGADHGPMTGVGIFEVVRPR